MLIVADVRGTCPHCGTPNRFEKVYTSRHGDNTITQLINGKKDRYSILRMCRCTDCGEIIIFFEDKMIHPIGSMRPPCPKEVPVDVASDYFEACLVEPLSKKASAALARRCLQNMLRDRGITKKDLSKEIDEAMKTLPSHLSEAIDAIRNVGNFAAHPMKSKYTGFIVDVEEGEAEWLLDVLEQLFDFYYVQPAITRAKKAKLDEKLESVNKPPAK